MCGVPEKEQSDLGRDFRFQGGSPPKNKHLRASSSEFEVILLHEANYI